MGIYKPKGRKTWRISWTDEHGGRQHRNAHADKRLSEKLLAKIEEEVFNRKNGFVDPADEKQRSMRELPIGEHIDQYEAHLSAKGSGPRYIARMIGMLRQSAADLRWSSITDIDGPTFTVYLNKQKFGARTFNYHRQAVSGFTRWLVTNGRLSADPMVGVPRLGPSKVAQDRRRVRMALSDEQVAELLRAADETDVVTIPKRRRNKRGEVVVGTARVNLPHRRWLYDIALNTGFRAGEMRALCRSWFNFTESVSTVTIKESYAKSGREDTIPLSNAFAVRLAVWLDDMPMHFPLWPGLTSKLADVIRADADQAGIQTTNEQGEQLDFHALRHTYVSRLIRSGVNVKAAQELARHTTPSLTLGVYAHTDMTAKAAAVEKLGDIGGVRMRLSS